MSIFSTSYEQKLEKKMLKKVDAKLSDQLEELEQKMKKLVDSKVERKQADTAEHAEEGRNLLEARLKSNFERFSQEKIQTALQQFSQQQVMPLQEQIVAQARSVSEQFSNVDQALVNVVQQGKKGTGGSSNGDSSSGSDSEEEKSSSLEKKIMLWRYDKGQRS